jgi:hypothetical protein
MTFVRGARQCGMIVGQNLAQHLMGGFPARRERNHRDCRTQLGTPHCRARSRPRPVETRYARIGH